jgi:hypothetical protein
MSLIFLGFSVAGIVQPDSYFHQGAKIEFRITADNGAKSYSEIQIKDVLVQNGRTIITAQDQRKDDQGKTTLVYRMRYIADSTNWCVSALNHLNSSMLYSSNNIPVLKSDSLVYPYAMKAGDTLLPAKASEVVSNTTRSIEFLHRKVVGVESVTVGGESLSAFRITCTMNTHSLVDYGGLGAINTDLSYEYTEWFVPSKGIVKSERISQTGKTSVIQQ